MNIVYETGVVYTQAERQGLQWLGERNPRWQSAKVCRRSPKEFDLTIEASAVGGNKVAGWFVILALREFVAMRVTLLHGYSESTDENIAWAHFDRVLAWASAAQAHPKLEFSENLISCVQETWQALAEESLVVEDNEEALELVCDANRMCMLGEHGRQADRELDRLQSRFGWSQVSRALARQVKLV